MFYHVFIALYHVFFFILYLFLFLNHDIMFNHVLTWVVMFLIISYCFFFRFWDIWVHEPENLET